MPLETNPQKWNRRNKNFFVGWEKFWRRTALWEHQQKQIWKEKCWYEKMQCECWNIKFVARSLLRNWQSRSCWCLMKDVNRERKTIHWDSNSDLYRRYQNMKNRCEYSKDVAYHNYWWRWIKCEWQNYEDFKNDMGKSFEEHYKKFWRNTVLDRIDVNWNYCKDNCRRVTRKENNSENSRHLRKYLYWVDRIIVSNRCWLTPHRLSDKLHDFWWDFNKLIDYLEKRFKKEWPFGRPN